jgi:hypothetical protein
MSPDGTDISSVVVGVLASGAEGVEVVSAGTVSPASVDDVAGGSMSVPVAIVAAPVSDTIVVVSCVEEGVVVVAVDTPSAAGRSEIVDVVTIASVDVAVGEDEVAGGGVVVGAVQPSHTLGVPKFVSASIKFCDVVAVIQDVTSEPSAVGFDRIMLAFMVDVLSPANGLPPFPAVSIRFPFGS